jgi:hypothetical protein
MPRSRAAALSAVAAAAVADPHLFDANCGLEDAVKRLRSIHGVGEWTAQYIALRQLREPDAFPAADICAPSPPANDGGRPQPNCSTARKHGVPGGLMPLSTSGPPPEGQAAAARQSEAGVTSGVSSYGLPRKPNQRPSQARRGAS